jgi:hypothetical protein
MPGQVPLQLNPGRWKPFNARADAIILLSSIVLQLGLGLLFGHIYDMRIFMATGYLVASGQNPYVAQDLTAVFDSRYFQGMTSIGYLPPWPLLLGWIYRGAYALSPNLLLYNLAIKIPAIAANLCLAFLVARILNDLGAEANVTRRAWIFMLLNPLLLYVISAWGQFDSIVALCALASLVLLDRGRWVSSAALLALAIALKPVALPILPAALVYQMGKSVRQAGSFLAVTLVSLLLLVVAPFGLLGWDASPILRHWNAHFTVGGGMSFLTFYELLKDTYQLPGLWWLLGLAWIPALGMGILALRPGIYGFVDLLKKSTGLLLVFYLTRAWLSEPNIALLLPFVLILTSIGELHRLALAAVWGLPLIFTLFNASPPQLLFPAFPAAMESTLHWVDEFRTARLIARTALTVAWQVAGWKMVFDCYTQRPAAMEKPARWKSSFR